MSHSRKLRWLISPHGAHLAVFAILTLGVGAAAQAQSAASKLPPSANSKRTCHIADANFDGWKAETVSNDWVTLTFVPQLGGRLMQVTFAGHPFLFVNPKFQGKYFPPVDNGASGQWTNYGGDKIWPMPEGTQDAQHWPGPISDVLDDGEYGFKVLSQGAKCTVRLEGPADPRTGLQYSREITLTGDSPEIHFRAMMKNTSNQPIEWSMQSVSQYDTSSSQSPGDYNHDFWAFTRAHRPSAYLDGFHVRAGLADDPSFSVKDGMFTLHWLYLQNEVWVDSPGDWVAVTDRATKFAMIEKFKFHAGADYPGKASVIFYKNGPSVGLDAKGMPVIHNNSGDTPYYMEAELNSPMARLRPGQTYAMDTQWYPTRTGDAFTTVTSAGLIAQPVTAAESAKELTISGSFGVLWPGKIVAHFYDAKGAKLKSIAVETVDPANFVTLNKTLNAPAAVSRISLRLVDEQGIDRGSLGEAEVSHAKGSS
ncbi:MAG: hypothetical protein ACRD4M_14335 [Candidatus Acidiferrales bacterium]